MEKNQPPEDDDIPGLQPGRLIGKRYRLTRPLGQGGFAEVWAADDTRFDAPCPPVAIKFLVVPKEILGRPQEIEKLRRRFRREASTLGKMRGSRHIVSVIDVGEEGNANHGDIRYIVMHYLTGSTLELLTANASLLPIPQILEIFLQIAEGMVTAHAMGVVHRDLKPENIFITDTTVGRYDVTIVDFGIARDEAHHSQTRLTARHSIMGTYQYMSPEQIKGIETTSQTDVYSMGCMLYEACAGRPPFLCDNWAEATAAHLREAPMPVMALRPEVSKELAELISLMMSKDAATRPTMEHVFRQLRKLLETCVAAVSPKPVQQTVPLKTRGDAKTTVEELPVKLPTTPLSGLAMISLSAVMILLVALGLRTLWPSATTPVHATRSIVTAQPHEPRPRLMSPSTVPPPVILATDAAVAADRMAATPPATADAATQESSDADVVRRHPRSRPPDAGVARPPRCHDGVMRVNGLLIPC